jgi:hypothetical protein
METAIAAVAKVGKLMKDAGGEPFLADDGKTLNEDPYATGRD